MYINVLKISLTYSSKKVNIILNKILRFGEPQIKKKPLIPLLITDLQVTVQTPVLV